MTNHQPQYDPQPGDNSATLMLRRQRLVHHHGDDTNSMPEAIAAQLTVLDRRLETCADRG